MKTKYVLTALALPALLAACTNDDFMDQRVPAEESSLLKDRAKVELTLKAERVDAESPATRLVGQDGQNGGIEWFWEGKDDKIGAVLVDYVKGTDGKYEVVDAESYPKYVLTNYPFAPQISTQVKEANFATQTAVVKGAYVFYNRYDGQNIERGKIYHEIPRILKANEGHEAGLKQVGTVENGGQNFFISPIINIGVKDGEEMESYVAMKGVHSVLKFTLDTKLINSEGDPDYYYKKGFTVNKIVLNRLDGKEFNLDFTLNPAKLAEVQKTALEAWVNANGIEDDEKAYRKGIFDAKTGAIIATGENNEDIQAAINVVNPALTDPRNVIALGHEVKSKDLVYQLAEPKVMKKGETMELMVVVPSDQYGQKKGITNIEEQYEGKTQGVFLMTVYTSEGIYRTYLLSSDLKKVEGSLEQAVADNYIFGRGKMYTMPKKTLKIGGGETNITLFEQAKGFDVETTEDWNYTIDYIKDHFRDYGNVNDWNTPTVRLVADKVIDVDADHYFPAFPVKYEGDATLNLKGQSAYVFNPTHAIFAKDDNRPTLQIVGQAASTITFEGDIKADIKDYYNKKGEDGTSITAAVKLLSDAKISVAKDQEVNFELLESATDLNVAGKVIVTETKTTETAGKVTVAEEAVVTINGAYNNIADVTILEDGVMTLEKEAQNAGTFDIWGTLNSETYFTNSVTTTDWEIAGQKIKNDEYEATLTVQGWAEGMNNTARGEAFFNKITNGKSGVINTIASKSSKANYGGLVVAGKLTENKTGCVASATATLTNNGIINDGGELFAANVTSTNEIRLGADPYALIWLGAGNVTAGKTEGYNGSVILEDATEYPMVDNYYTKKNSIAIGVKGIIETSLNNEDFADVMADHKTYNGKQQTAWARLNQITLLDDVKVGEDAMDAKTKTFILADNAKLTANKTDITVKEVIVEGKGAAIAAVPATGAASQVIKANKVNVLKGAELTVEAKADVIFARATVAPVLNVDGKLLNKGYLDVVKGSTFKTNIFTTIGKTGELVNEGRMSKLSDPEYDITKGDEKAVADLIAKFFVDGQFKGTPTTGNYRVECDYNNGETWTGDITGTHEVTADIFKNILVNGTWKNVANSGYYGIYWLNPNVAHYMVYFNTGTNSEKPDEVEKLVEAAKATATSPKRSLFDQVTANLADGTDYDVTGTWFNITNEGILDLLFSANPDNAKKAWAYGQSNNGDTATKKGKFTNEME